MLKIYRSNHLFDLYEMYQIPLVDETLEARFGGQIVCTYVQVLSIFLKLSYLLRKNVYSCTQTLVVLVHDLCVFLRLHDSLTYIEPLN